MDKKESVHLELVESAEKELLEVLDPVTNFMFMFRNNVDLTLNLIESVKKPDEDALVNLICHFFFENIINQSSEQEEILTLCYHLLDREISNINTPTVASFLHNTVIGKIIKSLTKRIEFKNFASMALGELIMIIERNSDSCLEMDLYKLNESLKFQENNVEIGKISKGTPKHYSTHDKTRRQITLHLEPSKQTQIDHILTTKYKSKPEIELEQYNPYKGYLGDNDSSSQGSPSLGHLYDDKIELTEGELILMYERERNEEMKQFCKYRYV